MNRDDIIASLGFGEKWTTPTISYSFYQEGDYPSEPFETNVQPLNQAIENNITKIVDNFIQPYINITLEKVEDTAESFGQIRYLFSDGPTSLRVYAYAYLPGNSNSDKSGDVHLNPDQATDLEGNAGSFAFEAIIHETLHALGLKHPGRYSGDIEDIPPFLPYEEDNNTNTIMSYNNVGSFASSPMPYDILVLQELYGASEYNSGDTIYEFNTVFGFFDGTTFWGSATAETKVTIWDSSGVDTLDFSRLAFDSDGYRLDLREGANDAIITSQLAYNATTYNAIDVELEGGKTAETYNTSTFGTAIAFNTVIENVIGSSSNDEIIGNAANNRLIGFNGDTNQVDILVGGEGEDIFVLGDQENAFYRLDSNSEANSNEPNYAVITDFVIGDKFEVHGIIDDYSLTADENLYGDADSGFDTSILFQDQQIAIIADTTDVNLERDFIFLNQDPVTDVDISFENINVSESDGNAIITLTLSQESTEVITVDYTTVDDTAINPDDYTTQSGTISFEVGATSQEISIPIIDDSLIEAEEIFFVDFSNVSNATLTNNQAQVTIVDDDLASLEITIDDISVSEGERIVTVTVNLNQESPEIVTVDYTTVDDTATSPDDYTAKSGNLSFQPGETTKEIPITIINDNLNEINETFLVSLSNATVGTIAKEQAIITIIDNDEPIPLPDITIEDLSISESIGVATISVSLSKESDQMVTVDYTTVNDTAKSPDDYISQRGILTFEPGETTKEIEIEIIDDQLNDNPESFLVKLSNPINSIIPSDTATITITDENEPFPQPSFLIGNVNVLETARNALVRVNLTQPSPRSVSVDYFTVNGTATFPTDYVSQKGTIIFNPGEITKDITIPIVDDSLEEIEETFSVQLTNAVNSLISQDQAEIFISDNDIIIGGQIIQGTNFPDNLIGSLENDLIVGNDGNDLLEALEGNDTVIGSAGSDEIYGNQNDDRLNGELGNDTIYGGQNNDYIDGGEGNDLIYGNKENDTVIGSGGNDEIYGNQNDDRLNGELGNDTIYGGQNNDYIDGSEGNDLLYGNKGNDTLIGGRGADVLTGNENADIFRYEGGFTAQVGFVDQITDFSSGLDKISLATGADQVLANLSLSQNTIINITNTSLEASNISDIFTNLSPNFLGSELSELQVAMIEVTSGSLAGDRYLFVNDTIAGGQGNQDLLIQVNTIITNGDLIIS
jgi:hypothetical protein